MRYTVVMIPDEDVGGFTAFVPAIPGCVTQGETLPETLARAQDAASALLADYAEAGEDVPTEPVGTVVATIEAEVSQAVVA
jgi:antitoxin HicB